MYMYDTVFAASSDRGTEAVPMFPDNEPRCDYVYRKVAVISLQFHRSPLSTAHHAVTSFPPPIRCPQRRLSFHQLLSSLSILSPSLSQNNNHVWQRGPSLCQVSSRMLTADSQHHPHPCGRCRRQGQLGSPRCSHGTSNVRECADLQGMAPVAHVLWSKFMRFSSQNPKWINRDRFVLSNGHACALQYIMLHLCGYKVSMDDLKNFRQIDSITPGHPEVGVTDGIEVTTGPLGQGIANAVGLAIAQAHMGAVYNKDGFNLIDNKTYVFLGDGCLQEGVASEACSLAGHLKLGNLIAVYDDNSEFTMRV